MNNNSIKIKKRTLDGRYDVSDLHEVGSKLKNIIVNLFNIEEQEFVYCSQSVKRILGYQPQTLIGTDWNFWYSLLRPKERPVVQQKLSNIIFCNPPVRGKYSFIYHVKKSNDDWISVRHEICHTRFAKKVTVLSFIYDNSERELIKQYLDVPQFNTGSDFGEFAENITDREKEVLKLIACGLSSRQIAQKLYISRHTVISHRKNLIKKFGVKNTAELIKEASKVIEL